MHRSVLLVVATLFSLALAEIVIRLLPEPVVGFHYSDGHFSAPHEFEIHGGVNRFGSHDIEYGPKADGVRRILLLGDSYVQGIAVPVEQTVSRRLAHHLEEKAPGRYDVASLAAGGFTPANELKLLQRHGAELDPDLVITVFYAGNDVLPGLPKDERVALIDELGALPVFSRSAADFEVGEARLLWFPWSALNRLVSQRITISARKRATEGVPIPFYVYAVPPDANWKRAWRNTESILLETRAQAAALGADYALVSASSPFGARGEAGLAQLRDSYPPMREGAWDLDQPDRILAAFAREYGIPCVALQPRFRSEMAAGGPPLHWRSDGHWNAAGHDRAAAIIADFVLALDGER